MERIGRSKLDTAKSEASGAEKAFDNGRSIFSLLVKANLSLTEKGEQRMSDADVLARKLGSSKPDRDLNAVPEVPTFLVAGHETTRFCFLHFLINLYLKRFPVLLCPGRYSRSLKVLRLKNSFATNCSPSRLRHPPWMT